MISIYYKFRNLGKKLGSRIYHQVGNASAKRSLANVELSHGKTDSKTLQLCDEYAKDVFGWVGYSPWLQLYSAVAGTFKEGWIPNNYYGKIVVPIVKGGFGKISGLKTMNWQIFRSDLFPDLAYFVNGIWLTTQNEVIPSKMVNDVVFKNCEKIIFKLDHSGRGEGIYVFDTLSFDLNEIQSLGNGVIQKFITQHEFFDQFMPSSVATIRMTTVIDNQGLPSIRGCYLKIGRSKETHVKDGSDIIVSVDLKNGELDSLGYIRWRAMSEHPDTQVSFAGNRVPNFDKCISAALQLQKLIPQVRCVGWDLVINNNDEVEIMEWNGTHNGITQCEATQGPCFSDLGWEKLWR